MFSLTYSYSNAARSLISKLPAMSSPSARPVRIPGATSHDAPKNSTHSTSPNPLTNPHALRLTGASIPTLMYGTAWKKQQTAILVYQAIKAGFRGIDTAAQPKHYQEQLVGEGIRKAINEGIVKRKELFIQTKFTSPGGQDPNNMPYDHTLPVKEQVHASIASSLQNLRVTDDGPTYLDAVLLHSPLRSMDETMEAWDVLMEYVNKGSIRHIGISNVELPILERLNASSLPPAIVQNRFYPAMNYETALRAFCRSVDIIFQSFWTLTGNPMLVTSQVVKELSERAQVEEPVALYALVLGLKNMTVLIGTQREERMVGDLMGVELVGEWARGPGKMEWEDFMNRFREVLGEDL